MTMDTPLVSIVIPTRDRAASLSRVLDCLNAQRPPLDRAEVLLIDDSAGDETLLLAHDDRYAFSIRHRGGTGTGAVGARNLGASEARGEILLMLDDDILVRPEFVSEMVAVVQARPRAVVVGTLIPHGPENPSQMTPFQRLQCESAIGTNPVAEHRGADFRDCLAGLLAMRRDVYWEIGGMRSIGGSSRGAWTDVLFGYQAMSHGVEVLVSHKAVAYHDDHTLESLDVLCQVMRQNGREAVRLFEQVPELSAGIPMFRDMLPINWKQDGPRLVLRKVLRRLASGRIALWGMEQLGRFIEEHCPSPLLLRPLYRWICGGHIHRGYHEGLQMQRDAARAGKRQAA